MLETSGRRLIRNDSLYKNVLHRLQWKPRQQISSQTATITNQNGKLKAKDTTEQDNTE